MISKFQYMVNGLIACCALSLSALATAGSIIDMQYSDLEGGRAQFVLTFDGRPPEPKSYSIDSPARIAIDFPSTASRLSQKYLQLGNGNVRSAVVVESEGRTRLVINLVSLTAYSYSDRGNQLVLLIGDDLQQMAQNKQDSVLTAAPLNKLDTPQNSLVRPSVKNIDFRRSEQGSGQVIIEFNDSQASADVVSEAGRLKLTIEGYVLPQSLQRRLDVIDFATPVQYIDAVAEGDNTIIYIDRNNNTDFLAYQADNILSVEVVELAEEEIAKRQNQFPYQGDRLSLNFQDIEVRSVLQLIADFVSLNLVASDTVGGNITLRLKNVPWDQALDLVLKTKGLDKRLTGNVLLVAPSAELAEREQQELEVQNKVEELAPLVTEFIQINYARATEILEVLKSGSSDGEAKGVDAREAGLDAAINVQSNSTGGFLSSRGSAAVDERTNTLIIRDTAKNLENVRRAIQIFDIPVGQVLIEARIVVARATVGKHLGVRWGGGLTGTTGNIGVLSSGSVESNVELNNYLVNIANGEEDPGDAFSYPNAHVVDLAASPSNASSIALGFRSVDYLLDLELSALETSGQAEIVSQPKVVTADGQPASIISATSIPYRDDEGRTTFRDAGLQLIVTPQITPDSRMILDLSVSQDSVGIQTSNGLAINTNSLNTQVLVNNGETLVLGGVYRVEEVTSVDKTPFFGDLPLIGRFFRRTLDTEEKNELLIFITPKLLDDSVAVR